MASFNDRYIRIWCEECEEYHPTAHTKKERRAPRSFITKELPPSPHPWIATKIIGGVIFANAAHPSIFLDNEGNWDYVKSSVPSMEAFKQPSVVDSLRGEFEYDEEDYDAV